MTKIDTDVLGQLPLADIDKVTFYKRDEVTADLVCCDVVTAGKVRTFHGGAGWLGRIASVPLQTPELPNRLVCRGISAAP
jgi:hypothetical protein